MKLWVVLIVALATAGATRPSTSPTSRSTSAMRRSESAAHGAALQSAVAELTREIHTALRSGQEPPREQSDYFETSGSSDLPPEVVIAALRRPNLGGNDPRVQAYVKWQLLSALPAELDEKSAAELIQAYRDAPLPSPRLGMEKRSRDELDRLIRNARQDDADSLANQFDQMSTALAKGNGLVLKYRDALFARLPPRFDVIAAGLEDIAERIDLGTDPADHAKVVLKAIEMWASDSTSPPTEQLREVSGALKQLEKREGREFYSKLRWSDSTKKVSYSKSHESLSGVSSQVKDMETFLDEKINNPTAPLKLKDEK